MAAAGSRVGFMDMSQYHDLFLSEAREHLEKISELVVVLEADHEDRTTIDSLFRSAHSVKGMAASMGFDAAAGLAHSMEDLMDRIRKGMPVDAALFDLLLAGESTLSAMLDDIASGGSGALDAKSLLTKIAAYPDADSVAADSRERQEDHPDEKQSKSAKKEPAAQKTIKVKTAVLDRFVDTTGELITVKHRLTMLAKSIHNKDFTDAMQTLDKYLRELHGQVMAIRLMPLSVVTDRFPRTVRDLARKAGKEITFSIKGAEIELDRSIHDLLGDPLSHLLRNSIDHGIETPQERTAKGKSAAGRISISVSREKDQVTIRIEDNGRGMDPDSILAAAVARGFLPKEKGAALSDDEKLMLICHPGFSTAEKVTSISGRGVGMDVVRSAIQSMGGSLSISTETGAGSAFLLRLPHTIAIINVLLVKVGVFILAIPLTAVSRTMELKSEDIATMADQEFFFLDDETVPIVPLAQILNIPSREPRGKTVQLFITEIKGRRAGLQVDQLLGNQEVFVKPLHKPLSVLERINGATVLGNGEVVFILDILRKVL